MSVDPAGETSVGPARRRAAQVMAQLREAARRPIAVTGVDIGPALEQQIWFALRDGTRPSPVAARLMPSALGVGAIAASVRPRRRPRVDPGGVLLLIRGEIHARTFAPVAAVLARDRDVPIVTVRVGQAAASRDPSLRALPRLVDFMRIGNAAAAARHGRLAAALADRAGELDPTLGPVIRDHAPRLAVGAAGLRSATDAVHPRLLVTYDEAGSWGRLLVAEGRRLGVPVLDLPHGELVDREILVGAGFDMLAVYGATSRDLAVGMGLDPSRVRVVGSVRHDQLAARSDERRRPAGATTRITFAAQYPTATLTDAALETALHATLTAAGRVAPAHVRIAPHPIGPPGLAERWLATARVPHGVTVEVGALEGLHPAMLDSDVLITVTSQSVLEAAVVGIPALAIQPPGPAYRFSYAEEGVAEVATTAEELGERIAALRLPIAAAAAVETARAAVGRHLGPMDGRAAQRTADLMAELLDRSADG